MQKNPKKAIRGDVWEKANQPGAFIICQGVIGEDPRFLYDEVRELSEEAIEYAWPGLESGEEGAYLGNLLNE